MSHCFGKTCQRVVIVDTVRRAIIKTLSEDLRTALLMVEEDLPQGESHLK